MKNIELRWLLSCFPDNMPVKTWLPILGSSEWGLYEVENAYIEPFSEDCIILDGNKDE